MAFTALLAFTGAALGALPPGALDPPDRVDAGVSPVSESVGTPDAPCGPAACTGTGAGASAEARWDGAHASAETPECNTVASSPPDVESCQGATPGVGLGVPTVSLVPTLPTDGSSSGAEASDSGPGLGVVPAGGALVSGTAAAAAIGLGATGVLMLPAARRLLVLLVSPLATRLMPARLLDDNTRRRIYETIRDEPGVNLKALAERLGIAWGTLLHHIRKLETAHLIVSQRYGKYRRYFLNGGAYSREERAQLAALSSPATARVAALILDSPGATQREIGALLGVSPSTVLWHAKRLEEVELVEARREGRCVRYFPRAPAAAAPAPLVAA